MNIWPRRLELKKETKAGSNQPPARDPVQFKLELMPNYLISYLENTGSRCTRYVSMPLPNESSILPKFLEKSDPEVARPAFSTWPVQKSQPKAFEVCAGIQIHQSAYRDRVVRTTDRVNIYNRQSSTYNWQRNVHNRQISAYNRQINVHIRQNNVHNRQSKYLQPTE